MNEVAPTGFLGLSHLGVVSSIGWASLGSPVRAVDREGAVVDALSRGAPPVHEPGLDALLAASRERMVFSTDPAVLADCPLVVVARDVPTDADNRSDPSAVLELVDLAVPHLRQDVVLALMSQVPPGFTRRLGERIRGQRPDLRFRLHYWIETLVFGRAVQRFLEPERIMVGCADPREPLPEVLAVGLRRFGCPVLPMRYEGAELTKTAINLYLCSAVTYANTLSDLCEAVGADWAEMMPALRLDARIGPAAYIRPGLGIAGGNLERDLVTLQGLCREHTVDGRFIDTLVDYNGERVGWVHRKLREHVLAVEPHPVVAVWGLAYKRDTRSTKNSMALRVIGELQGCAEIRAYDPMVGAADLDLPIKVAASREEALIGADVLLILTDWPEFAALGPAELQAMRRPVVIDCVGVVSTPEADVPGVRLVRMGRAPRA